MKELLALALVVIGLLPVGPGQLPVHSLENYSIPTTAATSSAYRPVSLPIKSSEVAFTSPAASALAIDATTGQILYSKNEAKHLPIASITKLVTVLTVLSRHDLGEIVTIPALPDYLPEDETMGLVAGQKFILSDLIKACLVQSANDAADALAIWDAGSTEAFTGRMNALLAQQWGIGDTHFASPSGLQDKDNFASATALAKLAALALASPTVRTDAAMKTASISDQSGKSYTLSSTNQLLADTRFHGLKTGFTEAAGQCFVGYATVAGHDIITVILGSNDRFGDTTRLVNWITQSYTWL